MEFQLRYICIMAIPLIINDEYVRNSLGDGSISKPLYMIFVVFRYSMALVINNIIHETSNIIEVILERSIFINDYG